MYLSVFMLAMMGDWLQGPYHSFAFLHHSKKPGKVASSKHSNSLIVAVILTLLPEQSFFDPRDGVGRQEGQTL